MNVTPEIMAKAKAILKTEVSEPVLRLLLEKIPSEEIMTMSLSMMEDHIRTAPAGTPEQTVAYIMQKMKKLSDARKEDTPGNSKQFTRKYFDSIWLEQRLMHAKMPDTALTLFGETFASPIMTAALSHLNLYIPNRESPMVSMAAAAKEAGIVHWVGMCEDEEFDEIAATGARIIRIIKPYADEEKTLRQIKHTEESGALAVGLDIDHTFDEDGELDVVRGEPMAIRSAETLRRYIESTSLPFVIKGVLSVQDALACAEIGAKGIMVSSHGGRMKFAVPPLMVLPEIAKAVGGKMEIFADGGVTSGADVYKALALGANAVGVGNHFIPLVAQGGSAAVANRIKEMTKELKGFMANTGVADTRSFDPTVLHFQR